MNFTAWIDVALGLTIVYLGTSLFVTIINEYISQALSLRGRQLVKSIAALIDNEDIKRKLSASPALKPFFEGNVQEASSYVDPGLLARMLVGTLSADGTGGVSVSAITDNIKKLPEGNLKIQLQGLVVTTTNSIEDMTAAVSQWVDRSLTMLGEHYKRWLQIISFGIGLLVASAFNIDTIALSDRLYSNKEARDEIATYTLSITEQTDGASVAECMKTDKDKRKEETKCIPLLGLVGAIELKNSNLGSIPIGWNKQSWDDLVSARDICKWIFAIIGWILTALAVSLGAPFWFDLLNNLVNIRHSMVKPQAQKPEGGK